ncbi:OLC1v1013858C1 [Oldenlandia corymbosa var. corymbosa]|uniref:OLC1v1013858C1 n=1 Tax=Oldenlandia corymbosa var. corymbosa TaxID=529605 RepID=A0AAV1DZI1_OLDCO|nr:OLC1v1013858C1 [Oldenlandia corymbosa var. corymbosa]
MEPEDAGTPAKPPPTTSLFPVLLQPSSSTNDTAAGAWLQNSSFKFDAGALNNAVPTSYQRIQLEESSSGEDERAEKDKRKVSGPQYELVNSSASDRGSHSDDEETTGRRRHRDKKKRKRRKKESSSTTPSFPDYAIGSRKPDVRTWASSTSSASTKEYYFDSRGDRNNLEFGSLYRMDVARYKVHNSKKTSAFSFYRFGRNISVFDGDDDLEGLDSKLRLGGRYWSAQYAALERHRNLKRFRVLPLEKNVSSTYDDFISFLDDGDLESKSQLVTNLVEESWEDEVLRRTKEYNKLTREKPHDEKVWIAFADFQDKVASMQPQKGARLQTLEKKISILEKATELNPDNEDLLLSLLKAYHSRDSTDVLIGRWEKILVQNSGSYRLWREFLRVVQGEFSRFKISEMRKFYANAVQALSGACSKMYRQVQQNVSNGRTVDRYLIDLELGLVDIFLSLCRFEWQAGFRELATALFQAEIEYTLFCPSLLLSEQSKRRLFEHFWNSNGARIGEDGALGWATWLAKEEEQREKVRSEESSHESEEGGWTGWSEIPSKTEEERDTLENNASNDMAVEDSDDILPTNDDTETLLKKLGIDTTADANIDIKDVKTWSKWSKEELARDCDQWMPVRAEIDAAKMAHDADADGDEQLLRVIVYEDVADFVFSLISEEAQLSLVSQFIEFFGGRIPQWDCTNSMSWYEGVRSLEAFPHNILEKLRKMHDVLSQKGSYPIGIPAECLQSSSDESATRTNMMKFVRNAALLCLTAFPQNYVLEEAVLIAEELSNTQMNSSLTSVTPCRALAKSLLKRNRQDILLCGVYARREAAYGNIDHARKIFDMALSSIGELPLDVQSNASLLHLWYAEMEVANKTVENSESSSRAVHILSCLGCGIKYSPYRGLPSSLQQLRARQGFKERIKILGSEWAHGRINDFSNALICSAALFEELTTGPAAAIEILDMAFSMVLPERRRRSHQLEILFNCYVKILCQYHHVIKIGNTWEAIVKGLQMYPLSPYLYTVLVEFTNLHMSPNRMRWILDEYCGKTPSVVACFFSLAYEMSKGSSQHRIRAVFERALESDKFHDSVVLWRWYIAYEINVTGDLFAARKVFFRAIHACPWSKILWLDGFISLSSVLTAKELSDLQEVMRDKELNLRTDIYEILLQDEMEM